MDSSEEEPVFFDRYIKSSYCQNSLQKNNNAHDSNYLCDYL